MTASWPGPGFCPRLQSTVSDSSWTSRWLRTTVQRRLAASASEADVHGLGPSSAVPWFSGSIVPPHSMVASLPSAPQRMALLEIGSCGQHWLR